MLLVFHVKFSAVFVDLFLRFALFGSQTPARSHSGLCGVGTKASDEILNKRLKLSF